MSESPVSTTTTRTARTAGWRVLSTTATDLLFPPRCVGCEAECRSHPQQPLFCPRCATELAISDRQCCVRCAMPCSASDLAEGNCGECRRHRQAFDEARALGMYDGAVREAVLKIKHYQHEPLAAALGMRLAEQVRERPFPATPELVVPVSMHWLRRIWQGASAAESLAASAAAALRLPVAGDLLVCRRWLRKQGTLLPSERRVNVRNAWRASRSYDIRGARVLLVDDVMTTGATAHEASRALRRAGAVAVYVAVVARGTGNY